MSTCHLTFSANAGVVLQLGQTRIWVDALHCHAVQGFSTLTPELLTRLREHPAFAAPDLLVYTHRHPDHFSKVLTAEMQARWPLAQVILPEPVFPDQFLLSRSREQLCLPEVSLRFARLPHEGAEYAEVAHVGCVLEHDGFRVLVTGDCAVASPALAEFLEEVGPVDLALVDFPWITLRKGRDFIRDHIRPSHLVVCHLPFAEDDCFCYRAAAEKAAVLVEVPDVRLLLEPFQQETF